MTSEQNVKTDKSLKYADTSNQLTRDALRFQIQKTYSDSISQHRKDSSNIAVAESSNVLTRQTLKLAQRRFIIENRPWVGIKIVTLDTLQTGKSLCMSIVYQNYGKIPALESEHIFATVTHTIPTYSAFNYPGEEKILGSVAVLPPGESYTGRIRDSVTVLRKTEYDAIMNKELFLYVYGIITYSDVFKSKDTTTFCVYYDVSIQGFAYSMFYNRMK